MNNDQQQHYQQISTHINNNLTQISKYQPISTTINAYQQMSTNINKYYQKPNINKTAIATTTNKHQQINKYQQRSTTMNKSSRDQQLTNIWNNDQQLLTHIKHQQISTPSTNQQM